jgi:hypothetical protein
MTSQRCHRDSIARGAVLAVAATGSNDKLIRSWEKTALFGHDTT